MSRAAGDNKPRAGGRYQTPIIFSQTEIESIGLHAVGRLRLLDGFVHERARRDEEEGVKHPQRSGHHVLKPLKCGESSWNSSDTW